MNQFEHGLLNSGLILNFLLQKQNNFTIYLEDGSKFSGTLLGWDSDFLLLKEDQFLQMVRLGKIIRIQTELKQLPIEDRPAVQDNPNPNPPVTNTIDSIQASALSKKPTFIEVKTPAEGPNNNSSGEHSDSKTRLDQLVKGW